MGSRRAKTKVSKINKHELHQQKQKRLKHVLGGFLIFIMVLSIFGINSYNNNNDSSNPDGFYFKQADNGLEVVKTPKGKDIYEGSRFFMKVPSNRYSYYMNNSFNATLTSLKQANVIYVVSDPTIIDLKYETKVNETSNETYVALVNGDNFNETLYEFRIQELIKSNMLDLFNKEKIASPGVTINFGGLTVDPVVRCNNASKDAPVILIDKTNSTNPGIYFDDYCIKLSASNFKDQAFFSNVLMYDFMIH